MKTRSRRLIYTALAVVSTWGAIESAHAHHSFARFDFQKTLTLEGTVAEWQWTNPHTWLYVFVADGKGGFVKWGVEGNSPNTMVRAGLNKGVFKVGDKINVEIHPDKDPAVIEGSFAKVNSVNGVPFTGKGLGGGEPGPGPGTPP